MVIWFSFYSIFIQLGVCAGMTSTAMENLLAAARLHLTETESTKTALRLVDFASIIPSLTGKIELVYEGEQEGADYAAQLLIDKAVITQFEKIFPIIRKL